MMNFHGDRAEIKRRIDPIDHLINLQIAPLLARYKSLVERHNELRGDSACRTAYSQELSKETSALEEAQKVCASSLALLDNPLL